MFSKVWPSREGEPLNIFRKAVCLKFVSSLDSIAQSLWHSFSSPPRVYLLRYYPIWRRENYVSLLITFYIDEIRLGPKWKCPHRDGRKKEAIQSMKSYTPQKIAMLVMSNPDEENLKLQKSVDKYVKRLSF